MATHFTEDAPVTVRTVGMLELPGTAGVMVAADLVYRVRDCFAVTMVLRGPDDVEVSWTFAWDLLERGLSAATGEGEVRVGPVPGSEGIVEVVLASSFGARMAFPTRDIAGFLRLARPLFARGLSGVSADLDRELAAIMEDR
jgi:hypothetical protein